MMMFLSSQNETFAGLTFRNMTLGGGYLAETAPPDTATTEAPPAAPSFLSYTVRCAALTPFTVIALICNLLSACAIMRIRGPRTVHHTLLMNLAACDMVSAALLWMYSNSPVIYPKQRFGALVDCLFITVVVVAPVILSLCTSSLSLLILALNQYIAICSPLFSATRVTRGRAIISILCVWLIATLLAFVPGFLTLFLDPSEACKEKSMAMGVKSLEICGYLLAGIILIIIILYFIIYREVLSYRRRIPQMQADGAFHRNSRPGDHSAAHSTRRSDTEHNYKAFITTFLLTGTLVIFWLPYMVFTFLSDHVNLNQVSDAFLYVKFYVVDFLPMLNFIVDPVIYGIRIREIRLAYRKMFAKVFPCCIKAPRRQTSRGSVRFTTLKTSI